MDKMSDAAQVEAEVPNVEAEAPQAEDDAVELEAAALKAQGWLPVKPMLEELERQESALKSLKKIFSLKDLKQGRPLTEMENVKFKIKHCNPTNFYLYITPRNARCFDAEFYMKYCIRDWVRKTTVLPSPPGIASIVLVPHADDDDEIRYFRALILKLSEDGTLAYVHFCDVGAQEWVETSTMKPICYSIMEFPRLVYSVVLDGVSLQENWILWPKVQAEIMQQMNAEFNMQVVSDCPEPDFIFSAASVKLWYKSETETTDLSECVSKLQTWEWEKLSGLKGQDADFWPLHEFNILPGVSDRLSCLPTLLPRPPLPVHHLFKGTFSKVSPFRQDNLQALMCATPAQLEQLLLQRLSQVAVIMLFLTEDQLYGNYLNVLHKEIERYTTHIEPTEDIHHLDFLLIRIHENATFINHTEYTRKWLRAMMFDGSIYLLDIDEYIYFLRFENIKPFMDIRRPYREFFKIPRMAVPVHVMSERHDGLMRLGEAIETFEVNGVYNFRVTKAENGRHYTYVRLEKVLSQKKTRGKKHAAGKSRS